MTSKDALPQSFVESIAGITAGIVSTLCLHPLDLIKTRLQVDRTHSSRLGGSIRVAREIFRNEGGITAFYRGLTPNIIGNSTSWGAYFLCYSTIKDAMRELRGSPGVGEVGTAKGGLSSSDYFVASGTAGLLTALITNPIWVLKTRMLSTGSHTPGAYKSLSTGARQILRTEGLPGFYRGLLPALFGVSHGALQFMAYEKLKVYRSRSLDSHHGNGSQLGNLDYFVISGVSKVFAGCVTYPYQVLRSRLQTYDAHLIYRGAVDAIAQIWVKEGLAGFYKGLGPNLFRVLPSTWVTFLVYENTKVYLSKVTC